MNDENNRSIGKKDLTELKEPSRVIKAELSQEDKIKADESNRKIELLKKNLTNLESKVKDLRETRQQKKNDTVEQQKKLNKELISIVKKHSAQGQLKEEDIAGAVQEQVKHEPNSLTKENIKLRDENQKLKDQLLNKNKEVENLYLQIKELKRARDDGLDRIGELSKIIESKQYADEQIIKNDNHRGYEADRLVREQKVVYKLCRTGCLARSLSTSKRSGKTT